MTEITLETPDVRIAQHLGFLTLRLIALEHHAEQLRQRVAQLEGPRAVASGSPESVVQEPLA